MRKILLIWALFAPLFLRANCLEAVINSILDPDLTDLIVSGQLHFQHGTREEQERDLEDPFFLYGIALKEYNYRFELLPAEIQVEILQRLQRHDFWNTLQANTAKLNGAFYSHDILHQGGTYLAQHYLLGTPLPHFGITVSRGSSINHEIGRIFREVIRDSVPAAYEAQGPERRSMAETVRAQDRDPQEEDRTTHFNISQSHVPLVHAQVQSSSRPDEHLHFQRYWTPDELSWIPQRKDGEIYGELGRLFFFPDEFIKKMHGSKIPAHVKEVILQLTLAKVLYWVAADTPIDQLFFQITPALDRRLKQLGLSPNHINIKKEIIRTYDKGPRSEYVFMIDRQNCLKIADSFMRRVMQFYLKQFTEHPQLKNGKIILEFNRNEVSVLTHLGMLGNSAVAHELKAFDRLQLYPLVPPLRLLSLDFWAANSFAEAIQWFRSPVPLTLKQPNQLHDFTNSVLFEAPSEELKQHPFIHFHFSYAAAQEALKRIEAHVD